MKRILLAFACIGIASCTAVVEPVEAPSFEYSIGLSQDAQTKLTTQESGSAQEVVWERGDSLGVYVVGTPSSSERNLKAVVAIADGRPSVSFTSSVQLTSSHRIEAYSPFNPANSANAQIAHTAITLSIPQVQQYDSDGDFCLDAAPQVSVPLTWSPSGTNIHMVHLASLAKFNIYSTTAAYRSETVKSVCYKASGISGSFTFNLSTVDPASESTLAISPSDSEVTSCAAQGTAVGSSKENGGKVMMALAPGAHGGEFTITTNIATYKYTVSTPIAFNRSKVKTINVNLASGTRQLLPKRTVFEQLANCYVVDREGNFAFLGTTIGNGNGGIVSGGKFHTASTAITPSSACLLWEDVKGFIANVAYDPTTGLVNFTTGGNVGNAVIAVKDGSGTILWSWHIWGNGGQAIEDETVAGQGGASFQVMDRALGAHSKTSNIATLYQWGRKDPFPSATTYYRGGSSVNIQTSFPVYEPSSHGWYAPKRAAASYTATLIDADVINAMSTNRSKTVILASPNNASGYILGFRDTVMSYKGPFASFADVENAVAAVVSNTSFHFKLTKTNSGITLTSVEGDFSPNVGESLGNGNASALWGAQSVFFSCSSPLDKTSINNATQFISDYEDYLDSMILFRTGTNTSYYLHASTSAKGLRYGSTGYIIPRTLWLVFEVTEGSATSTADERILKSIQRPGELMPATSVNPSGNNVYTNNWLTQNNILLWGDNGTGTSWSHGKTIYDPCPAGYRVAGKYTWSSQLGQGYPKPGRRYPANNGSLYVSNASGALYTPGNECSYLTSAPGESDASMPGYCSSLYLPASGSANYPYLREWRVNANAVRCVKEN